eukprot:CAMPEP_0170508606 /NCGR_PEP_ID=MMETSP0208-20121228/62889_1 /TAXON_ID=197538 /ORGANISM="Strombidium inclinatum, Strain S3" /LENGTH=38 /DNA_ID= /DNA_START= /DNA_END= /DNA_ORIENTATION=
MGISEERKKVKRTTDSQEANSARIKSTLPTKVKARMIT